MEKIYFTLTGTDYYQGNDFLKADMKLRLVKDRGNEHDTEAIKVELEGLGKIGYVANSVHTRIGETWSAGRIYDRFEEKATGTVCYVMDRGVVCLLDQ